MSEAPEQQKRQTKKTGLGRGLGSLLGEHAEREASNSFNQTMPDIDPTEKLKEALVKSSASVTPVPSPVAAEPRVPEGARIWQMDISKIKPNQKQPRRHFEAGPLQELANSIKEKGILQPVVVRPLSSGEYEIIAGERRWRAAQAAGLHEVPTIIRTTGDQDALELALIENIQREDLNAIEEAEAYQLIMRDYGLTQQQVADKVGKDRTTVANLVRLLSLSAEVRALVASNQVSMGHAKVLLGVNDREAQKQLAERVRAKRISVRELEREVSKIGKTSPINDGAPEAELSSKFIASLTDDLQKIIGTKVVLDYAKGRGKISIHFYSEEELTAIVENFKDAWLK